MSKKKTKKAKLLLRVRTIDGTVLTRIGDTIVIKKPNGETEIRKKAPEFNAKSKVVFILD